MRSVGPGAYASGNHGVRTQKYLVERCDEILLLLLGRVAETDLCGVQRLPRQHRRTLRMHAPHICPVIADAYRLFDQHRSRWLTPLPLKF